MEAIASTIKRKKRKTRKCLDELRKRSRRNTDVSSDALQVQKINTNHVQSLIPNKNGITNSRLTIPMFNKAIISETVRRPVLSDIRNTLEFNKRGKATSTVTSNNCEYEVITNIENCSNSDENSKVILNPVVLEANNFKSTCTSCHVENLHSENHSPNSLNLFSNPNSETEISREIGNKEQASPSCNSSQNAWENYNYHLYEEFINEIPRYLSENVPKLLKDDVTKKNVAALQNLYLDECRKESEENILQCIRSNTNGKKPYTPNVSVVGNSRGYNISHVPTWTQESINWDERDQSFSSSETSSLVSQSPHATSPSTPALFQDTPEYHYYPHKLNH